MDDPAPPLTTKSGGAGSRGDDDMTSDDAETPSNTALDSLSRDVPDAAIGPEATPDEKLAQNIALVHRGIAALTDINQKLEMIARAFESALPEALKGLPLGDAVDLCSDFKLIVDKITGDSGTASQVKKRLDYVREVTMPELLDAAGVKTVNTDKFRVSKTTKIFASMNPEAGFIPDGEPYAGSPVGFKWLVDNELGSLIKPTVNASSLSATAKELISNGMELPEEMFKVYDKVSISITKKAS